MNRLKTTYRLLMLLMILMLWGICRVGLAQPLGYQYYKQITINSAEVQGSLSNFPVLISISDTDLRDNAESGNGYDIVFASDASGNNILDYEIESYNSSTGELIVWVRLPNLSGSSNTPVYMFYGNSTISTNPSTSSTWDNNFVAVQHLDNTFTDATSNGNNATNNGSANIGGQIADAQNFNSSSNDYLEISDDNSLDITAEISISGWMYVDETGFSYIVTKGDFNQSYTIFKYNGTLYFKTNDENFFNSLTSSTTLSTGSWYYLTFTKDGNGRNIYVNGALDSNDSNTDAFDVINAPLTISQSSSALDGSFDEVRISNIARSADWIQTEFNNQSDPSSFYSVGPQQLIDETPPAVPQNVLTTAIAGGNVTVSFDDLDESGSGVDSYSLQRSTTQGGPHTQIATITDDESTSYSYTDNTTSDATTYYYVVTATDAAGNDGNASVETPATTDGTAPVFETAEVTNTALQLDYDENLNTGSTPDPSAFTILVNGSNRSVSSISVTNDKVDLTLSSAVNGGDNVTLSYTAGTNALEDVVGNQSGNLASEPVTNNSDNTPPALTAATINSSSLKLSYSEQLDGNLVPAPADFAVRVNGNLRTVTNVQITGNRVNLTLYPAVASGDNVQFDYTAGSNPIQDAVGNQAVNLSSETATNNTFTSSGFGPDPCPITNNHDAAWACFDGLNGGTSMSAYVGSTKIADVDAVSTSQTTFAPNALQEWGSGAFSGDEYNGPQANPSGNSNNATSFDIIIPNEVPSNAVILSLNRLRPSSGNTTYTLEAFDNTNAPIAIDDWQTGQGTDGGVCTNNVDLVYSNGNTTLEFRPTVSGNASCSSSSTPVWLRITDENVQRIEIRKSAAQPDNIHLGLALVADFGDAPNVYNTKYNSRTTPAALHILNNNGSNNVYFGSGVDGDGNGQPNTNASGDNEDGVASLSDITTNESQYSVTLSCTDGGKVGGWVDFNQSGSFDFGEYASGTCSLGSVTLNWSGLSGLVTGQTYARFRIASNVEEVANPEGSAIDGEVEDYPLNILPPPETDLEIVKTVDNSTPVEGDNISFTVKLINNGPDDASGVQVTDQLPSGITYLSSAADQGTYNNNTGLWNAGSLSATDTTALVINASVNSNTQGQTITNSASVTSFNESDPNLSNNTGSSGINVITVNTDIGVSQTVDNNNPNEGEYINFTITAMNNGPRDASELDIIDQIPPGLSFESATPSTGSYDENSGIWAIGNLADGNNATLNLQVRVDKGSEGQTITNTVAVDDVNQSDDTNANNSSSVDVHVVQGGIPVCGVTPEMSFSDPNPQVISGTGGQVGAVYLFKDVITGVDAEVEIITSNNAILNNIDVPPSEAGADNNFQPQVEVNDKNQNGYMDFEIRFVQSGSSNSVFISLAASGVDVDGDGGANKEYVGFQRLTSFTVDQSTQLGIGTAGIYMTFTPGSADNVSGIDVNNTQNLVYTTYTNEPQFRIRTGIEDPEDNGAASRYFSFNFDPCNKNLFPNGGTSTNIVDLGVTKSVDNNNPNTGETVNYTIAAENKQDNTVNNIEVTDQLPNGLTFDSYTASNGSYNDNSGIWDVGSLSGNESATLTITATVDNNTEGDVITNMASLSNYDGQDGNANNNNASVSLSVIDPNTTGCTEPPYFAFDNNSHTLEEGSGGQVGAVYRYANVRSGIDALVEITNIVDANLDELDSNLGNSTANFSPLFTATSGNGYIDWKISFVQSGTLTPIKQDFALSALDIDGSSNGGGSIKDYYGFAQNQASIVQGSNNIVRTPGNPFEQFISENAQDGNGSFDPSRIAYIIYRYTSVLNIRTGSETTGGYQDDRLVDIDFRPCINEEFNTEDRTNRNADISVTKTTDNANPLTGETVNFTITATNNGGLNGVAATELDVEDALPEGLTLVNKSPSQGTYNQTTNIWTIGTLNVGSSATLDLETTVDQDAPESIENKAFVRGLNQYDGNASNDSSTVSLQISVPISGTVFEDKTGNALSDGDTNLGDATGDQQAKADVKMHLFKDGGDGLPNGNDDSYLRSTTTNNTGEYEFQVGEDATYWIAVDSRTGGLSNGTSWAQQTYGTSGSICSDGSGGFVNLNSAGECFGGRRANVSDALPQNPTGPELTNAEHLAEVTMTGSEITDINFGFSFNVVTNINDGDDDGSSSRSIQGSLRQFIQNANAISGANTMRFTPVVQANSGSWWSITLSSALPAITDALTTINGKAYDFNNPTTERNINTVSVGTEGSVGTGNQPLNTFEGKELEINLNDAGAQALSINSSGAVIIRNMALYNSSNALLVTQTSSGLIEHNFIGTRADGSNPSGGLRSQRGIRFSSSASTSALLQQNYVAHTTASGLRSDNVNAIVQVYKNEIYRNGLSNNQGNGIQGTGQWTIEQNLIHQNGNGSSHAVQGGSGIELIGSQGHNLRGNTIRNNAVSGITVLNGVSSSLIEQNIIHDNGTNYSSGSPLGAGIKLTTPGSQSQQGIKISRNKFYSNNGLAIDIVGNYGSGAADGVNVNDGAFQSASTVPNRGVDYPVFTLVTLENSNLHIEGYVGTFGSHLSGPFTIEVYKANDDGDNDGLIENGGSLVRPHGEGKEFISTITTNADGSFSEDIPVGGSISLAINDRITGLAISGSNNTSEFGSNQRVVPTGVTVSGHVFNDDNHNQIRESGEPGLKSVTVVLYNQQENNCKSVLTNQDGYYEFGNVLNGNYRLIEAYGQSIPTPDVCTPAENDPTHHVSTTPNSMPLVINNQPATKDFGDFEGAKVQGKVFNDNGISGGTAHDVQKNGGESGVAGTIVKALTAGGVVIEQTTASADGTFTLFFAESSVSDGSNVIIKEANKGNFVTIGGDAGSTGGSYNRSADEITFTVSTGTAYSNVLFADVQKSRLLTDGQKSLLPGASGLFQHTFQARTAGTVTFTTQTTNNPSQADWSILLYRDLNDNGEIDSGEPMLNASNPITVSANENIELLLKVTVPLGVDDGANSQTTINAEFAFANTSSPAIINNLSRTDLVEVNETNGGLEITKSVDKAQALPGSVLTYTIDYINNGDEPISSLEIKDEIPAYTTYKSSNNGSLPNNLTNCSASSPPVGDRGTIIWTFTGNLLPGQGGTVTYKVEIEN